MTGVAAGLTKPQGDLIVLDKDVICLSSIAGPDGPKAKIPQIRTPIAKKRGCGRGI
jgi:hypothetical protein